MANIIGQRVAIPQIADPSPIAAQHLSLGADAPASVSALGGLFQAAGAPFMNSGLNDLRSAEAQHSAAQTAKTNQEIQTLVLKSIAQKALQDKAAAGGDLLAPDAVSSAIGAGMSPDFEGGYARNAALGNPNNPVGGDAVTRAALASGQAFPSTVAGTNQAEANRVTIAQMQAQRQADAQIRGAQIAAAATEHNAALEPMAGVDANNLPAFASKGAISNGQAPGFHPAQSKDQVEALLLGSALGQGGSGAPSGSPFTSTPPAAAAPTLDLSATPAAAVTPAAPQANNAQSAADRLSSLPPVMQKILGIQQTPMTFINPKTNEVARSMDGGVTGTTVDGAKVSLSGGGWVQSAPEGGVGQVREAIARQQAGSPTDYSKLDPMTGEVAQSALKATGIVPNIAKEVNAVSGTFGGPEIAPGVQEAQQKLNLFNQTVLPAFLNSENKGSREQAIVRKMLPEGGIIENPQTEAKLIGTIYTGLLNDNAFYKKQIASTPSPQLLEKYQAKLAENEKALSMITQGAKPYAQPGAPAPAAVPQTAAGPPPAPAGGLIPPAKAAPSLSGPVVGMGRPAPAGGLAALPASPEAAPPPIPVGGKTIINGFAVERVN